MGLSSLRAAQSFSTAARLYLSIPMDLPSTKSSKQKFLTVWWGSASPSYSPPQPPFSHFLEWGSATPSASPPPQPSIFPIIFFLSTTLLTGMTGISLHIK
jgi:hypothetical protein